MNKYNVSADLGLGIKYKASESLSLVLQSEMRMFMAPLAAAPYGHYREEVRVIDEAFMGFKLGALFRL